MRLVWCFFFFHLCRVTELKNHSNHFFLCFNQDSYGMAVEDKLYLLNQVALCITALRGYASRQLEVIYQHGEQLADKSSNAELAFPIKYGLWRFRVASGQVRDSLEIAKA